MEDYSKNIHKHIEANKETFPNIEALYLHQFGDTIIADPNGTEANALNERLGLVVTITLDGIKYESAGSLNNPNSIHTLFDNAIQLAKQKEKKQSSGKFQPEESKSLYKDFPNTPYETCDLNEKLEHAKSLVTQISKLSPNVISNKVLFRHTVNRELYINPKKKLSQQLSRFEAVFTAILKDENDGKVVRVFDGYGKVGGWEKRIPDNELLAEMIEDGHHMLKAKRVIPGFYDCIFDPSLSGILAHEAFGHGTEADTMVRKRAKGSAYLNKKVASDLVNISDSPNLTENAAGYYFDHEGQLSDETRIIENGILRNPITDHRSSYFLGAKRTANGRRESYDRKTYTRMSNTYFKGGTDKLDAMISSIENGLLLRRASNGMEDPKTWGIQLEALIAQKIENGKLKDEYYSPIIVTGNVPDILKSISMATEGFHINGLGMCGKGHKEWVKVTDGGPYLKLRARIA